MIFSKNLVFRLCGLGLPILSQAARPQAEGPPSGNPILKPTTGDNLNVGSPFEITWQPTTSGPVSLVLLRGPPEDLKQVQDIANDIQNSGSFIWVPGSQLENDPSQYAVQLIVTSDGQYQYSNQFGIYNSQISQINTSPPEILPTTSASVPNNQQSGTFNTTTVGSDGNLISTSTDQTIGFATVGTPVSTFFPGNFTLTHSGTLIGVAPTATVSTRDQSSTIETSTAAELNTLPSETQTSTFISDDPGSFDQNINEVTNSKDSQAGIDFNTDSLDASQPTYVVPHSTGSFDFLTSGSLSLRDSLSSFIIAFQMVVFAMF